MSDTLYQLVNPEFQFEFAGKQHNVRKATLEKAVLYQQRLKEIQQGDSTAADLKLAAYAIFLILKDSDPEITETFVLQNTSADIDVLECLTKLGFMNPQRMEEANKIKDKIIEKLTMEDSSPTSQPEQGGLQEKSAN